MHEHGAWRRASCRARFPMQACSRLTVAGLWSTATTAFHCSMGSFSQLSGAACFFSFSFGTHTGGVSRRALLAEQKALSQVGATSAILRDVIQYLRGDIPSFHCASPQYSEK